LHLSDTDINALSDDGVSKILNLEESYLAVCSVKNTTIEDWKNQIVSHP
jgi:hypothetical protein